jgi:hypothetical protein
MAYLLAAAILALITTLIGGSLGAHHPGTVYVVSFFMFLILGLPYAMLRGFANGVVDHQQDRVDEREEYQASIQALAELDRQERNVSFVDARTVNIDGRSITVNGEEPKEALHGQDKDRRGEGFRAQERKVICESAGHGRNQGRG